MAAENPSAHAEWLIRRDDVDYGPFATHEILDSIDRKEAGMGTLIADIDELAFEPLGSWSVFRDHYAKCQARWEMEAAEAEARRVEQRMRAVRTARITAFAIILVIALTGVGFGGWMAWRIQNARPTGLYEAIAVAAVPELPDLTPASAVVKGVAPEIETRQIGRLHEPIFYDTRGVGVEGSQESAGPVMSFNVRSADQLPEAALKRIMGKARAGMVTCAQAAAGKDPEFKGTRVRFIVRSGAFGGVTVGKEVASNGGFRQCVKRVLEGISVPTFKGDERKVTIPLKVKR